MARTGVQVERGHYQTRLGQISAVENLRMRRYDSPAWFNLPLDNSQMDQVNVFAYYALGSALRSAAEKKLANLNMSTVMAIWYARFYLDDFLKSPPVELVRSREAATQVLNALVELTERFGKQQLTESEINRVVNAINDFEVIFNSECQDDLRVFAVKRQGIYDTVKLVDHAEHAFEKDVRDVLPGEVVVDFNLAGRCLAFELWSATGFHAMRAVEYMARRYLQVVTGAQEIIQEPLGNVVGYLEKQLEKEEGTKASDRPLGLIVATLRRLNKIYRCPVMHPQMALNESTAKQVFDVSATVIPMIADDLCRRSDSLREGGSCPKVESQHS